eukprot:gene17410-17601_t
MLQQTTVATVTDYFERFITKWPTLEALAEASLDEVLVQWQGLGYYSRARNLHAAAKILAKLSKIPSDPKILKELPGIGDYTAAAIASIAFDYPIIPIDGNIMRVFARLFAIPYPLPFLKKEVFLYTSHMADGVYPGDFAQALMDLVAQTEPAKTAVTESTSAVVPTSISPESAQKEQQLKDEDEDEAGSLEEQSVISEDEDNDPKPTTVDMKGKYVLVNIPTYKLYAMEDRKIDLTQPVIVGMKSRETPIFTSNMNSVVLNPAWGVPVSIFIKDKLRKVLQDPKYLSKSGFTVTDQDGDTVTDSSVDWSHVSLHHFPYTVRQLPGKNNALGAIKLESPQKLATWALKGTQYDNPQKLQEKINAGDTSAILLKKPIPVYFTYITVWVDGKEQVLFSDDPYNLDKKDYARFNL